MRYIDRIQTVNCVESIRETIMPFVERISQRPEVIGIMLIGGVADTGYRRFLDEHSDIDFTIILDVPESEEAADIKRFCHAHQHLMPSWCPEFSFYLPIPALGHKPMEVNVHELLYQYERRDDVPWSESKREAYAYTSEIVYDPTGLIRRLIDDKTKLPDEERRERLITLAGQMEWSSYINPTRQVHRGYPMNGHDLLNLSLELLVESIYLYNRRHRPHKKWRFEMSCDLPWVPADYRRRMEEAQRIEAIDGPSVLRRVSVIKELWDEVKDKLIEEGILPRDSFYYTSVYLDPDRQVLNKTMADRVSDLLAGQPDVDHDRIKALINFAVIGSMDELADLIDRDAWAEDLRALFAQEIEQLSRNILNINQLA